MFVTVPVQQGSGRILASRGGSMHPAHIDPVRDTGPGASRAGRADKCEDSWTSNIVQLLSSVPTARACPGNHASCRHQLRHGAAAG